MHAVRGSYASQMRASEEYFPLQYCLLWHKKYCFQSWDEIVKGVSVMFKRELRSWPDFNALLPFCSSYVCDMRFILRLAIAGSKGLKAGLTLSLRDMNVNSPDWLPYISL